MRRLPIGLADTVALLEKSEFFSRLLSDDLYWLASRSCLAAYADGETVFRPGERASRFFIIRRGSLVVARQSGGASEEMARFVDGDVVGDFDFARDAVYDAGGRAVGPSEILVFPGLDRSFPELCSERPDVGARILLRSVAMISSRVRSTQLLISQNAPWVRELRRQMYTDAATGLWSRSYLEEEILRNLEKPSALLLIKPDRFKHLCDSWGHAAGDQAMERLALALKAEARRRRSSWAVRLKSNETAVAVSGCTRAEAIELSGFIASAIARVDLSDITGPSAFSFSASMALAMYPEDGDAPLALLEAAYGVLMKAWADGGNRLYLLGDGKAAAEGQGMAGARP